MISGAFRGRERERVHSVSIDIAFFSSARKLAAAGLPEKTSTPPGNPDNEERERERERAVTNTI